jgi:hypothetical protein
MLTKHPRATAAPSLLSPDLSFFFFFFLKKSQRGCLIGKALALEAQGPELVLRLRL